MRLLFFITILYCLMELVFCTWDRKRCINEWTKRLKHIEGLVFSTNYKPLLKSDIEGLCSDKNKNNGCRLGVTGWIQCCTFLCKNTYNPFRVIDLQTKSSCICNGRGFPKVIEVDCAGDSDGCHYCFR
ncbi:hypothetical protein BCR32DRAFT_286490 [Anaeromyces robustus]|uniref:Uncharacterized protein n=1 Tax=Anaeromyces robustus TaxID=1754192 RepID=A0A1Y1VW28_9FUNG|nr:hypothetical protein BCR32DRAFT_286490 [Anaeromyces robustus]|eukprot:ORX65499.1 hypothetical protein BCR32DRAFT_286490 [Anaeromyces robustus]